MSKQKLPTKSLLVAILLALVLGPIGLFYSSVIGALIMLVVTAIIGFITFGLGLFISWTICIIWAIIATNSHNKKIIELVK
jgi:putative Ca2+/H+ antiporter (TMEM165/GDT1 family)